MAAAVKYPAQIRQWRQPTTWRKSHPAKGIFAEVVAGQTTEDRIPVFVHPCSQCGAKVAPFGYAGIWYCREHRPNVE